MVKLVDTLLSGGSASRRVGSSPIMRTKEEPQQVDFQQVGVFYVRKFTTYSRFMPFFMEKPPQISRPGTGSQRFVA